MNRIRVLIVDDSSVIRRVVAQALTTDELIEVIGSAPNGKIALEKIEQTIPDVVILDVEMPEMDGLETLEKIRQKSRDLPVIMYSTLTHRGAFTTVRALLLGANDYVAKNSESSSVEETISTIRKELLPKIKSIVKQNNHAVFTPSPKFKVIPSRIDVVCIGSSTGGPNALLTLVKGLPKNLPVPIIIVQHMPPMFTQMLANQLSANSEIKVIEAYEGAEVLPGRALIAPGDYHLELVDKDGKISVALNQNPPENSCRPSVDVTFRSVVNIFGSNTLGVVLTGMGQDGLRGCEQIHSSGGTVIVQDEKTSVVWGMPGAVAKGGIADEIHPISDISNAIIKHISGSRPLWFPILNK